MWVGKDNLENDGKDFYISTIKLATDHSYGNGPPLWFETLVIMNGDWSGAYQNRYTTEEEARQGHEQVLGMIKNGKYRVENNWIVVEEG